MSQKNTRLSTSFYAKKPRKDMSPTKTNRSLISEFDSPTSVPQGKNDVEIINLTCGNNPVTPRGAHLANPNVNVVNSFQKKLLGAKSRLGSTKPTGVPASSKKDYHLSSASSLPKPHGHTSTSTSTSGSRQDPTDYLPLTKSAGSASGREREVVSSPYFSRESHYSTKSNDTDKTLLTDGFAASNSDLDTLLANGIAMSSPSDKSSGSPAQKGEAGGTRGAIRIPSVSSSGSSSCMQYSPAKVVDAGDPDLVVLSDPSPATPKFNDTSLGLESENTVFNSSPTSAALSRGLVPTRSESEETTLSNTCSTDAGRSLGAYVAPTRLESEKTSASPTSKSVRTFPALSGDAGGPTLSKGDFYISPASGGDVASTLLPSTKRRKKSSGDEVIFQKEELPGPKQYPKRANRGMSSSTTSQSEQLQRAPLHSRPYDYEDLMEAAYRNKDNPRRPAKGKEQVGHMAMVMRQYGKIAPPVLKKTSAGLTSTVLSRCQIGQLYVNTGSPRLELQLEQGSMKLLFAYNDISARMEIEFKDIAEFKHYNKEIMLVRLHEGAVKRFSSTLGRKLCIDGSFFRYARQDFVDSVIILHCKDRLPKLETVISGLKDKSYSNLRCEVEELSEEEATDLLESLKPTSLPKKKQYLFSVVGSQAGSGGSFYGQESTASIIPSSSSTVTSSSPLKPPSHRLLSLSHRRRDRFMESTSSRQSTRGSTQQQPASQSHPPPKLLSSERSNSPAEDTEDCQTDEDVEACSLPPRRRSTRQSASRRRGGEEAIKPNVRLLTYKPEGCKFGVELMSMDMETLNPGEFLNDKIMDFYLKYMMFEMLEVVLQPKLYIFSTFFYTRLSNASMDNKALSNKERVHSRVKTWTRNVDLFTKEFIVIPICDKSHWYVVLVYRPGNFDPSKVTPKKPARSKSTRSRRRKSTKPRKRTSKATSEKATSENPVISSPESEGAVDVVRGLNLDPLHVNSYNTDEEGSEAGDTVGSKSRVPGERIAAAVDNMDTFQQQDTEYPISISETPPSTQLTMLSQSEKSLLADPGVEMWAGVASPSAKESDSDGGGGGWSMDKEGCGASNDTVREADMEWNDAEGREEKDFGVKLEGDRDEDREDPPCLMILDSLGIRRPTTATRIRNYLTEEWRTRKQESTGKELTFDHLPLKYPEIPLQNNCSDCGIFMLQYVETAVRCLQENCPLPEDEAGWGSHSHIGEKREMLKTLITQKQGTSG